MKKLLIMFFVSAAFVVFFSFEYSFGSDGSVFSNHGWGGESLSASPSTQLELSAESIATQDEINYALPVAFIQQVSLSAPVDSSQVRYDGTFQSAVRVHQDWLESLPEESLRLKCWLIYNQKDRDASCIDSEFVSEFERRHPEGIDSALAGSKRRRSVSRSTIDSACLGVRSPEEGVFARFGTTDLDECLTYLNEERLSLSDTLLLHTMSPKEFSAIVARQVENFTFRTMLESKKELDAQDLDLEFSGDDKKGSLSHHTLITQYFRRSLVPYPVSPAQALYGSEKSVELK